MKKLFSIFALFVIFVPAVFLAQPNQASALDGGAGWVNVAKEYGLDTLITIIQSRVIDKLVKDTYNWANGGFDGDPGFVNNWNDFLKGTQYDVISSSFGLATQTLDGIMDEYGVGQGGDGGSQAPGSGDGTGGQAQNNYNLWISGALDSARMVADTIARSGSQQLNVNQLNSLIRGEGETLSTLLGSKQAKEAFKTDFSVGGWMGYLALIDPHNTNMGLQGLVQGALSGEVSQTLQRTIDDIQTENKFLNQTVCAETTVGSDGEEICARQETTTPGNMIASRVFSSSDTDISRSLQAREFSDVLAKALGALSRQLLQAGVAGLADRAISGGGGSGGGFMPSPQENIFGSDYQSGYDVLGLNLGGGSGSGGTGGEGIGGGSGSGGTGDGGTPNPFGDIGSDGSLPYIGGPEDAGGAWNEGPELIIDLQQVLEKAINSTRKELANYTEIERLVRLSSDNIIKLDRCVPGPATGWDEKWQDFLNDISDDYYKHLIPHKTHMKASVNASKVAAMDPKLNIPGAARMKALVDSYMKSGDSDMTEVSISRAKRAQTLAVLLNIESVIRNDFNQYRENYHPDPIFALYPLFAADWEKLTQAQKLQIFSLQHPESGQPGDGGLSTESGISYLVSPYYLFKPGETPESVLADNEAVAMNAVLSFAWNLWQEKKGQEPATEDTPSGVMQKSNIRYRYYIMQNDIATDADVLKSSLRVDETIENNKTIRNFLDDCLQFKHYATGYSLETLEYAALYPFTGRNPTLPTESTTGGLFFLRVSEPKTDQQIKDYLYQQRQLQEQGLASDFKTDVLTSYGSIESSILGFETEEEKLYYFESLYDFEEREALDSTYTVEQLNNPTAGSGAWFVGNATNVADIYRQDYVVSVFVFGVLVRAPGGSLFCRIEQFQERVHYIPICNAVLNQPSMYYMSIIEYRAKMSGI